jgi:hypothetical protein
VSVGSVGSRVSRQYSRSDCEPFSRCTALMAAPSEMTSKRNPPPSTPYVQR